MDNETKIKNFLNSNHGYILTSDFLNLNISKPLIKKYLDKGLIKKVSHGIYIDSNLLVDDEYVFQLRYPNAIFSYHSALSLLGLINESPKQNEVTINSNKRIISDYKIHYASDKYFELGIIEVKDMFSNPIKIYNAERCICDVLKDNNFDSKLQNEILHAYFQSEDKDINKLLKYAKTFNIYDKVSTLVDYAVR